MTVLVALAPVGILVGLLAAPVAGQATGRVSVGSGGEQGNAGSSAPSISGDGRFVAFLSAASNLVPGDTNGIQDVFVRDRRTGATERVSVDSSGAQADGRSFWCSISADGRTVAFRSAATNLVPGDTNGTDDIFVRSRLAGTTERVSVDSNGAQGDSDSLYPFISADGRCVAFNSWATNLVVGDTNGVLDVFVRDRRLGTTERVSVDSRGVQSNGDCGPPSISADGRWVTFASDASDLVGGDTNGDEDAFVHDRVTGATERASVDSSGIQADDDCSFPWISADGRFVAFASWASNLGGADTNGVEDIFVRDRLAGTTERVSVDSSGAQGNSASILPSISADGRFVSFESWASDLVGGDWNGVVDAFVHDRETGATERASVDSVGAQGNQPSFFAWMSADGRCVVFSTLSGNLVPGDTNGFDDVFVRDRDYTPFEILCHPGRAGVVGCPCLDPPSAPDRGCDNSELTGGALLWASGVAYLSADSLSFTTGGEVSTATSLVLQGNALLPTGRVFGQGVRCAGGSLVRLYTKTASVGSITAPQLAAGDPTVSARSSARGDPIQAGQSRWYLVYYRDPIGANGCPAAPKFNATPTVEVAWFP